MSFIPDPSLALGNVCYLNGSKFYVLAQRCETTQTGTKVQYQVTSELPGVYTTGPGPYPHPYTWYNRNELIAESDWAAVQLARIEAEANVIWRTLTGKPFVWLYGDATESFYYDSAALVEDYVDAGIYVTDLEDGTQSVVITDTTAGPVADSTNVIVTGIVNLAVEGIYERGYYAVDSEGHASFIVTRRIEIYGDPIPPR